MNTLQESKMPSGNLYQKNIYFFHNLAYNQVKVLKEKDRQIKETFISVQMFRLPLFLVYFEQLMCKHYLTGKAIHIH